MTLLVVTHTHTHYQPCMTKVCTKDNILKTYK